MSFNALLFEKQVQIPTFKVCSRARFFHDAYVDIFHCFSELLGECSLDANARTGQFSLSAPSTIVSAIL